MSRVRRGVLSTADIGMSKVTSAIRAASNSEVVQDMMRPEDVAAAAVTVLRQPRSMRTLVWSMRSTKGDD